MDIFPYWKKYNFFQHPDSQQWVAEEIDMAWLVVSFMNTADHSPGTTVW